MTVAARKTEAPLLRERRALIESGIERKLIKLRGNLICEKKCTVGCANAATFFRDQHHSITDVHKQSREPTPICAMNATITATPTSVINAMSTAAADTARTYTCVSCLQGHRQWHIHKKHHHCHVCTQHSCCHGYNCKRHKHVCTWHIFGFKWRFHITDSNTR